MAAESTLRSRVNAGRWELEDILDEEWDFKIPEPPALVMDFDGQPQTIGTGTQLSVNYRKYSAVAVVGDSSVGYFTSDGALSVHQMGVPSSASSTQVPKCTA